MELILRSTALALCTAFTAQLLRRSAPELSSTLAAVTVAVILLAATTFLRGVQDLSELIRNSFQVTDTYTLPLMKCLGIALVTKIGGDLCRDASQSAAASAVELAGTACALGTVLPLLSGILRTIGGLL